MKLLLMWLLGVPAMVLSMVLASQTVGCAAAQSPRTALVADANSLERSRRCR